MTHVNFDPVAAPVLRDLAQGWTVTASAGPVPSEIAGRSLSATVPGCVHTDLLAAGLIPDPFLDDNESATAWIGRTDWTYQLDFDHTADGAERHELVFDGVDTVGTVELNGETLGTVDNMHRTWRFDVTELLVPGVNRLRVALRSPVAHADAESLRLGMRPRPYPTPYNAIRKMASSFGWDWGIATATSGLWRGVRLESWSGVRFDRLLVAADLLDAEGRLTVRARVRGGAAEDLRVVVRLDGVEHATPVTAQETELDVRVPSVEPWWPRGYGAPRLYPVEIELRDRRDRVLDRAQRRVGFRSVRWDWEPDEAGTPMQLYVNERPIYVRGVNWIPDDALITRVDAARYRRRLEQAAAGNVNLIRVWAGGIYESDDFFDACDELGLLSWQDLLLACAAYSEASQMRESIEAEVRDNLARIGHHPSLVLINGNNENLVAYEDWGWQDVLDDQTWGEFYYRTLFPSLVGELTPGLPYAPGSPFSPGEHPANAELHGSMHIWDMWNQRDWQHYRSLRPRFVAEFGWQAPPATATLVRAVHDEPLTPESPLMQVHQKAFDGTTKLNRGLVPHLPMPRTTSDWLWATQLNQAWALRAALTHFRALAPHNSGAIIWQLNDCWPAVSWAVIDSDELPKPGYYAMREAFAPRLVTLQPSADGLDAVLVNDTLEEWTAELRLRRLTYTGTVLAEAQMSVTVEPLGIVRVRLGEELAQPGTAAGELVEAAVDDLRDHWFFAEPRDSVLEMPQWQVAVEPGEDDTLVRLSADVLVRDGYLAADQLDPAGGPGLQVDAGLFTLLPGESIVVRIAGSRSIAAAQVLNGLRTTNQLVATSGSSHAGASLRAEPSPRSEQEIQA